MEYDIFSNLSSKEVINPNYIKDYEEGMEFFHKELSVLSVNIFIINKIIKFPLDLFCPREKSTFFLMVIKNFLEYSIIIISRLFNDTYSDCFTIPNFIKNINDNYIKQEYKDTFIKKINNIKFYDLTNDILNRVKRLRNKRFAHIIKNEKNIKDVDFEELENLTNLINLFFQNLSFNTGFDMLLIPYSKKVPHSKYFDSRLDIEKILDCVAKESTFLNYPEIHIKHPMLWKLKKKRMTKREIDIFYKYREKCGLPKI